MPTHPRSPTCAGRVTLGSLLLIPLAVGLVAIAAGRRAADAPFSKWRWIVSSGMRSREMALDYLENHFVPGMTVQEVMSDLGDPDHFNRYWSLGYDVTPDDPSTPSNLEYRRPGVSVWFGIDGRVSYVEGYHLPVGNEPVEFDSGSWQRAAGANRTAMACDLVREGLSNSMRKEEVIEVLGTPDSGPGPLELKYSVGVDSELEFKVGDDGRIERAGVDGSR